MTEEEREAATRSAERWLITATLTSTAAIWMPLTLALDVAQVRHMPDVLAWGGYFVLGLLAHRRQRRLVDWLLCLPLDKHYNV
jgi:hypothetical protein